MTQYILRRLLLMIPVAFLVTILVFVLIRLSPGDPLVIYAGEERDPVVLEALRHEYGLDQPMPTQYISWLTHALRGDLGRSLRTRQPVLEAIVERMPATTLATASMAVNMRQVRSSLLDAFNQEYIRTARAKGLGETVIIVRHALKNALIPVVTIIGLQVGAIIEGAIVTEQIYFWPGIGKLAVDSIGGRDYPVVQAIVLLSALSFMVSTLVVDVLYAWLDPRISYGGSRT